MVVVTTIGGGAVDRSVRRPARTAEQAPPPAAFDVGSAYAEHAGALFAFAVNALGDRGAAEDALQEVFVRAWRARDRYGSERGSVRTWLFAIARNVVVDAHRARGRRLRSVEAERAEQRAEHAGALADPYAASLDRLLVVEALARLSEEHRRVVVEVHLGGASYAEVSARTGVPVATLRTRMYYGLRALRAALDQGGEDRA